MIAISFILQMQEEESLRVAKPVSHAAHLSFKFTQKGTNGLWTQQKIAFDQPGPQILLRPV